MYTVRLCGTLLPLHHHYDQSKYVQRKCPFQLTCITNCPLVASTTMPKLSPLPDSSTAVYMVVVEGCRRAPRSSQRQNSPTASDFVFNECFTLDFFLTLPKTQTEITSDFTHSSIISLFSFLKETTTYLCVYEHWHVCHLTHVQVRAQLSGVNCLPTLPEPWRVDSGWQDCWTLPTFFSFKDWFHVA